MKFQAAAGFVDATWCLLLSNVTRIEIDECPWCRFRLDYVVHFITSGTY
jgi:hypothetical protein